MLKVKLSSEEVDEILDTVTGYVDGFYRIIEKTRVCVKSCVFSSSRTHWLIAVSVDLPVSVVERNRPYFVYS